MPNIRHDPAVAHNRRTYESRDIVGRYVQSDALYPAEYEIFDRYRPQFRGRVLDIAIGAGRTTKTLLPMCAEYVGLDFSESMIAAAQRSYPGADLRVMDMRDVPREFATRRFDAILISFNAIDYIAWEDRCTLIWAILDLLEPDGVFAFSTHDLAAAPAQRGFHLRQDLRESLSTAYRPRSFARLVLRGTPWMITALRNRRRNSTLEKSCEGYAYVNDSAEDYGLVTLYADLEKQTQALKAGGFSRVERFHPGLNREPVYFNYYACQR